MSAPKLVPVSDPGQVAAGGPWDAVIVVCPDLTDPGHGTLQPILEAARHVDADLGSGVHLIPAEPVAGGRLIASSTGPVRRDQDDVRRWADAAAAGLRRARDAGAVRPLIWVHGIPSHAAFTHTSEVTALAAAGALWEPLEAREALGEDEVEPVIEVGIAIANAEAACAWAQPVEAGRRLARDLAGTEPERMAPPRFAELCQSTFEAVANVSVTVEDDREVLERDYPLLSAVARCSYAVERHQPRVIRIVYDPGNATRTVLLAGKGITYDTGGADVKAGGAMAGMSRDKGGAAAVAGLVLAAAQLKLPGVKLIAELGAVRNSIGSDAYVADEILTSHAGCRVRVGNTDAEGRMVLADLLSHLRVDAIGAEDPRLFTVATLTGHAGRAVGPYSIALDNGPARDADVSETFSRVGDLWGDPFDISRLRREDFDFVRPRTRADDVLQCNNAPSTLTPRGHQFPMAFLIMAAGLDTHGRDSDTPLPYTHVDIGGSGVEGMSWQHGRPTAAPLVCMLQALCS